MGTSAVLELHSLAGEHKQFLFFEHPMSITINRHVSESTKSTLFFPSDTKLDSVSLGKCTEKNWKFTSHEQLMAGDKS